MGIIDRIKEDFYQRICSEHVLVLAALDVDSVCACKILQALFKADNVEHTLIPVSGKTDLQKAYSDHSDQVKSVVLINCGGCLNLLELLQPPDLDNDGDSGTGGVRGYHHHHHDVTFFIVDSRRPLELDNVYNQDQVHVVLREGEQLELPDFDDIYASDMDEDSYDDEYFSDEEDGPRSKRRRIEGESTYETRKKRHLWRRKREEIMYKYYEFNCHSTAASLVMYELAWKMSRDNNDLLWWAIIGLTEQLLYEKIDREKYVTDLHHLQPHVIRNNRSDEETPSSINSMRITFDNELRLALYRHWSLYDSLCNSEYTVCKLKIWSMKGHKRLLEFLADMGLPLTQCKQKYAAMDVQSRDNLKQSVDDSAKKYQLDDITYSSFIAQFGYKTKLCASDMVFCTAAVMECPDKAYSAAFLEALETLSRSNLQKIQAGIELAKQQHEAIVVQVRNFIDTHQVVCAGPFIYAYVEEGTPNVKNFSKPLMLLKLARFLREAWIVQNRKNKEVKDLPFILSAPLNISEGSCLVVGVPPHSEDTRRSEFTKAFQHAADRIQARASFDYFDGSVIELQKDDRGKFFDALTALSAV